MPSTATHLFIMYGRANRGWLLADHTANKWGKTFRLEHDVDEQKKLEHDVRPMEEGQK